MKVNPMERHLSPVQQDEIDRMWADHEDALLDQPEAEANPGRAVSSIFMRARQYIWEAARGI